MLDSRCRRITETGVLQLSPRQVFKIAAAYLCFVTGCIWEAGRCYWLINWGVNHHASKHPYQLRKCCSFCYPNGFQANQGKHHLTSCIACLVFFHMHISVLSTSLSRSLSHPLPCVSLGERDRRSRRWQRHEGRIDWSVQEQFHVSAHSFKSGPHPIPSRRFEGAHKYLCVCKMCATIKRQIVSGWPRDTVWMSPSRFLFSPASLWPSPLTVCLRSLLCSLISSLGPSGAPPKVSAFPLVLL